jgi:hypothetical protein
MAPEFFIDSAELTQESRKLGSKETIAATIDQLMQICINLRNLWTINLSQEQPEHDAFTDPNLDCRPHL